MHLSYAFKICCLRMSRSMSEARQKCLGVLGTA